MKKKYYDSFAIMDAIAEFMEKVGNIQGADVVEVVRCNDCANPHNRWTGCPRMNGTIMEPDDYCSYGRRKEGEG